MKSWLTNSPEAAAALRCADKRPSVTRYVLTYINRDGRRTLMTRSTYAAPEKAQAFLEAIMFNNSAKTIAEAYGADPQPEVRPFLCHPSHSDPQTIWFDQAKKSRSMKTLRYPDSFTKPSPEAAAALRCADKRFHDSIAAAAHLPLAEKIVAIRAARERAEEDYRFIAAGEYALVHKGEGK